MKLLKPKKKFVILLVFTILVIFVLFMLAKLLILERVGIRPITYIEVYNQIDKKYGTVLKKQLFAEKLIESEAKKRKIVLSDKEVDQAIKLQEEQSGGKEVFERQLQISNLTFLEYKNGIRIRLLIEKVFAEDIKVEENEVKTHIESNKGRYPQITNIDEFMKDQNPANIQLRQSITEQIKSTKLNENFNQWINQAYKDSRVVDSY